MGAFEQVALLVSRLLTVLTVVVARCLFMVWRMPDCSNLIVINPYRRSTGVYSRVQCPDCRQFSCYITKQASEHDS